MQVEMEAEGGEELAPAVPVQGRVKPAAPLPPAAPPPPNCVVGGKNVHAYRDLADARARVEAIIAGLEAGTRKEAAAAIKAGRQPKFEDEQFPADARSLFRDPDRPWCECLSAARSRCVSLCLCA